MDRQQQVAHIARLTRAGLTIEDIRERTGLCQRTISKLRAEARTAGPAGYARAPGA